MQPDSGFKFPGWATNLIEIVAWFAATRRGSLLLPFEATQHPRDNVHCLGLISFVLSKKGLRDGVIGGCGR
jgi:hypothetical protein